jgi:Ethanolamine utilization protein EutJ (predicted chaperonin)
MLDNKCKKASIVLQLGDSWHNGKDLIYLRKDLLKKYLKKKNIQLLWIVRGERNFKSKHNEGLKEFSEKHKHYRVFGPHFSIFKL